MEFTEAELRVIKFLFSMIYQDKSIDKLNNLEYYDIDETMDRLKGILDKLRDVEICDRLKECLEEE